MIRWIRSLFAWRCVWRDDAWSYHENPVTGDRMAVSHFVGVYVPFDACWVEGKHDKVHACPVRKPPIGGSGVQPA